jgi:hypothetical protein
MKDVVTTLRSLNQRRQIKYVDILELNIVAMRLDSMVNDYHFVARGNQVIHYV